MGIYDRDYYREQRPGLALRGPRSIVGILILINVVLYLANGLITPDTNAITSTLSAKVGSLARPWMWWQFLTYGFVHAPSLGHIVFNMLGLWFLGREVELHYGRKEFLRLYLALLVVGSVIWAIISKLEGAPDGNSVIGASGAVAGIVVLFALNFPRRTLLLFFVLPVPAWVAGVLLVVMDVHGAINRPDSNIAYTVHLAGAAFALLYFRFRWNFSRLGAGGNWMKWSKRQPNLRVHDPDRHDRRESELGDEVDRILAKIHSQGEASLTRKERRTLENASRRYQRKRRD